MRPDIMYAVHQIAKYSVDLWQEQGDTILYLVRSMKITKDTGILFKPDPTKEFEFCYGTDFSGNGNG